MLRWRARGRHTSHTIMMSESVIRINKAGSGSVVSGGTSVPVCQSKIHWGLRCLIIGQPNGSIGNRSLPRSTSCLCLRSPTISRYDNPNGPLAKTMCGSWTAEEVALPEQSTNTRTRAQNDQQFFTIILTVAGLASSERHLHVSG